MSLFEVLYTAVSFQEAFPKQDIINQYLAPALKTKNNQEFSEIITKYTDAFSPHGMDLRLMALKEELAHFSQEMANLGLRRRGVNLTEDQKRFLNDRFALKLCSGIGLHNQITEVTDIGLEIIQEFAEEHRASMGSFRYRLLCLHISELKYMRLLWDSHMKRSFMLSNIGCYAGVSPLSVDAADVMYQFINVLEKGGENEIEAGDSAQDNEVLTH
jgi:hypothetical protein